jgi:heptosyltransferase-2/heptosyltransferase-3
LLLRAGLTRDWLVDVAAHPLLPGEHATEQWRRLAQLAPPRLTGPLTPPALAGQWLRGAHAAQIAAAIPGCSLRVSEAQRTDLHAWLMARGLSGVPVILVQIGNKRTMRRGLRRLAVNHKYWPNERWAEVIRHVRATHPRHAVLLLGTGPEHQLNQQLLSLAQVENLYNVADDLPVPRLVALLQRAAALITVDSGPAHAAAAVGCPQVVLFGKALPSLYRPWGSIQADVKLLSGELAGAPDMLGITTREVIEAWSGLTLRGGPG